MDPQATWNEMLDAIAESNMLDAELRAEALLDWIDRGGFVPQTLTRVLPDEWDRLICRYLCRKILIAAKSLGEWRSPS